MSGLVDSKENEVLDALLSTAATLMPDPVYIGLMTAAPNDDGSGVTEPSGGSYARVSVANTDAQWPAASSGVKNNANTITFPTATAGWGLITHFGIFDAASAGNLLAFGALGASRNVLTDDVFRFLATALQLTLD